MRKYVTKSGDMWDLIAYEQLGSCSYVEALINANRKYIDVYIFDAGTELIIPDVEEEKKLKNFRHGGHHERQKNFSENLYQRARRHKRFIALLKINSLRG